MKIAFLDTVHPVLEEGLIKAGHECIDLTESSLEEIEQLLFDVDGLVVRSRFPMNASFLDKATRLKFIARSGAGLENIDIPYCEGKGIKLFSAPEGNANAVSEHALGMLLALMNKLAQSDNQIRSGVWDREGNRGFELEGKVIGIIGYGNNGSAFARKLKGFDVDVIAYDKYKKGFGDEYVKEVEMDELFHRAEVLSLHIPQTEETIGLINEGFIEKMNRPFYLINISRGKIVITEDLLKGLQSAKILGACLDVLEYEKSSFENMFDGEMPEAFKSLLTSDKVILSPHVAGWTHESYEKLSQILLQKVREKFSN